MAPRGTFPDIYGVETSALPDIKGPLNIDAEGDHVPANDMQEIPDGDPIDPMTFVSAIESSRERGGRR